MWNGPKEAWPEMGKTYQEMIQGDLEFSAKEERRIRELWKRMEQL